MANYIHFSPGIVLAVFFTAVLLTVVAYRMPFKNEILAFRYRWFFGASLSLAVLLAGILLSIFNSSLMRSHHFSTYDYAGKSCILRVVESPSERANSVRLMVDVEALKKNNEWLAVRGKALVYLEKDSAALHLMYGDKLLVKAGFSETRAPANPHEFNYKRYLAFNNIHHQSYHRSGDWKLIKRGQGRLLHTLGFNARTYVLDKMAAYGIEGQNYALVSALLLGMRDALDNDMLKEFSSAGAMHVLCVSGLHVGIIFLVLNFAFSFLDKFSKGRYLKALLVIIFIWFYAIITGLAPSVMRASTMFSVITIGKALNRNTSVYNSLCFSAALLIVINPYIVAKLGFWLSYLAVLGIVYLHPKFYKWLTFKNKIADKIWSLACVSLAAQIATSPIAVYFFNQFPNYFLISNLMVVPLATLIVYSGVALVMVSFIPYVSDVVAYLLSLLLSAMRQVVGFIDGLPYATAHPVITQMQMFIVYAVIIGLILYFHKQKVVYLKTVMLTLIAFFFISTVNNIYSKRQHKMVVYSLNRGLGIDFIQGRDAVFVADKAVSQDSSLIGYHIENHRLRSRIRNVTVVTTDELAERDTLIGNLLYVRNQHLYFGNKKITLVSRQTSLKKHSISLEQDLVIFNRLPFTRSHDYLENFSARLHVLPPVLNMFERNTLSNYLNHESLFDMRQNGALILEVGQERKLKQP